MSEPAEPTDAHAAMDSTLRLLWQHRDRPASRRGPKPKLDLAQIIEAAIALGDAEGVAGISMQRVAERLGVAVGSLYTYVPGKPALLAVMLDTSVGWSTLPHELPGDWRQQFETWAREDWRIYRRHPWVIELATPSPSIPGPNMMDWMESALSILEPTNLTEAEKMAAVNAIDIFVRGTAREALDANTQYSPDAIQARDDFVDFQAMAERYPNVTRVVRTDPTLFVTTDPEFGLQRLLDGIELFIAARRG